MLISQADVEARLGRTLTTEEVASFNTINNAIQSFVERRIGSSVESVSPTSRYYDGGVQNLTIDPCTDITALAYVDDDTDVEMTFDSNEYTAEPINRTLKTMLRCRWGKFNEGFNNLKVTAKFSIYGDAQILAVVKNAILEALTSEVQNSSNISKESIEGYSVEYASTEAKQSLSSIDYLFPEV